MKNILLVDDYNLSYLKKLRFAWEYVILFLHQGLYMWLDQFVHACIVLSRYKLGVKMFIIKLMLALKGQIVEMWSLFSPLACN